MHEDHRFGNAEKREDYSNGLILFRKKRKAVLYLLSNKGLYCSIFRDFPPSRAHKSKSVHNYTKKIIFIL
jgi:hypothetical protein